MQCLKESIIKATGEGIHTDLAELDFRTGDSQGEFIDSTRIVKRTENCDAELEDDRWRFEEHRIDAKHVAAVCFEVLPLFFIAKIAQRSSKSCACPTRSFESIDLRRLLIGAESINRDDALDDDQSEKWGEKNNFWDIFI